MKKQSRISFANAVALELHRNYTLPVITNYELGVRIFRIKKTGMACGRTLHGTPRPAITKDISDARKALLDQGVFIEDVALPSTVHRLSERAHTDASEVLSSIDPFGFVSHLSAMEFHGLTDRLPTTIFFTTLSNAAWRSAAEEKMADDLQDDRQIYIGQGLPQLRHTQVKFVQKMPVRVTRTSVRGGYRLANDGALRIAKLGRTFLDMLRHPERCGGIHHVLDVYVQRAQDYVPLILAAVERHGKPIDKVRAGYILEERCGIRDERIDSWLQFAQRGGSRKLDAQAEYVPHFSERWMLSIND